MFEIFLKYLTDKIELSSQEIQLIESVCKAKKAVKSNSFLRKEKFGITTLLFAEVW
jgi:hypothetical protein